MTKVCKKCKNELSVECFHKNKNSKDGLADWCKECTKQAYIKNREKRLKYQRDYKNANVERFKEQQKRYRKKSDYYKKYEERHKEYLNQYRKNYFNENKEKILSYNRQYIKDRRKEDELFALKIKVRNIIKMSYNRKRLKKNEHTVEILGCDFEYLKNHLYKTFFENYGYEYDGKEAVHIDHIIPLATANTKEDVIRLCHYTNLQLLKPIDNLRKSAKI